MLCTEELKDEGGEALSTCNAMFLLGMPQIHELVLSKNDLTGKLNINLTPWPPLLGTA